MMQAVGHRLGHRLSAEVLPKGEFQPLLHTYH